MRSKLLALLLLLSAPLFAAEEPVMYSRETILILPHDQSSLPEGAALGGQLFHVEVRSASLARSPGWFSFSSPKENAGLMFLENEPTAITIEPVHAYAPTDILFLNEYGEIQQIFPSIVLAELDASIVSDAPALAVLYLKGGASERFAIRPGDTVRHKRFKKRQVALKPNTALPEPGAPVTAAPLPPAPPSLPWQEEKKRKALEEKILRQNGEVRP